MSAFVVVLGADGSGSVAYTLIGAGIAAVATLAAVALKAVLDTRAERDRHANELEKLRLQLADARVATVVENRRTVLAKALAEMQALYQEISRSRRRRRLDEIDDDGYRDALRAVDPQQGQAALEEVRLVASDKACEAAETLWHHLRSHDVPQGRSLGATEWASWKERYWELRQGLLECARRDVRPDDAGA